MKYRDFYGTEAPFEGPEISTEKVGIIFEFTPCSHESDAMWGQVHQVDVPTNDLQVVDFTHIYSSFIGSNYIHVMAVIPELVQPARVRMCSGFQFENTNTKKNMLKGP